MGWPGSIYLLILLCGLLWMLGKLWRLSRLRNRLRRTTVRQPLRPALPIRRAAARCQRRSEHSDADD
ncbi:hypothetical protein EH228_10740 [Erwinia endophytica]|nr:hypothetical protein EH228_10740 [Erwinia endophytica]